MAKLFAKSILDEDAVKAEEVGRHAAGLEEAVVKLEVCGVPVETALHGQCVLAMTTTVKLWTVRFWLIEWPDKLLPAAPDKLSTGLAEWCSFGHAALASLVSCKMRGAWT